MLRLAASAIVLASLFTAPAYSGAYRLEPGSQVLVDSDHQGYTTFYIRNLGQEPGRLSFPGDQFDPVSVNPGVTIELYGRANRPAVLVSNDGQTRIEVITRYVDRPRFMP